MSKVLIFLFILDFFIFVCFSIYSLIFNILILKNKTVIDEFFHKYGYKLYLHENIDGKCLSRKDRIKYLYEIVVNDNRIVNQSFFVKIIQLCPFIQIFIGCGAFIFMLLIGLLIFI